MELFFLIAGLFARMKYHQLGALGFLRSRMVRIALPFIIGWFIMKKFFTKDSISMEKLDSLFIYMVLAILIGARLGHVIFYETELLWQDPLSVVLPFKTVPEFEFTGFRGLASHGAAIGIIIALILYNKKILKKPTLWIFDRVVITVAIGGAFVRLGNFINSEIVGKPSGDHPFGIRMLRNDIYPAQAQKITGIRDVDQAYNAIANNPEFMATLQSVPLRHPTQLYEALGYVITFLVCWYIYWKTDKKKQVGYIFGWFLILLFMTRFVVEFFKEAQVGERGDWLFNTGQLLSIPFIIAGFYLLYRSTKKVYTE